MKSILEYRQKEISKKLIEKSIFLDKIYRENYYKYDDLDKFVNNYGYNIRYIFVSKNGDIEAEIKANKSLKYLPDIYAEKNEFVINPNTFGDLNLSEANKWIDQQKAGFEVLNRLNRELKDRKNSFPSTDLMY